MIEQKRIYSLNKLAYLVAAGANIQILFDEENKMYGICNDEQIQVYLSEYYEDALLHDFITIYGKLRKLIHENKLKS